MAFDPEAADSVLERALNLAMFNEADRLVLEIRAAYASGAASISVAQATSWLNPGMKLFDWLSDLNPGGQIDHNYAYLGKAIDTWATEHLEAAKAARSPTKWDSWANEGAELGKVVVELKKLAWEYSSILPQIQLFKGIVKDWAKAATLPFTPLEWPTWLKVGLGLAAAGLVYSVYVNTVRPTLRAAGDRGVRVVNDYKLSGYRRRRR